jgi:hypothetical protein
MDKEEKLNRVLTRIKNFSVKDFYKTDIYNRRGTEIQRYMFGDLSVDAYNGLLRVKFKDEIIDHYYDAKDGKDRLWKAIKAKKDSKQQSILSEL